MARKQKLTGSEIVPMGMSAIQPLSAEWRERLKEHSSRDAATAAGGGGWPFISLRGGQFTFNDAVLEQPLKVIILGARCENTLYKDKFDAAKRQSPSCWAIAVEEKDLAPPADLATKESARCEGCWANAFGSGDTGRGKACGNRRRIALLPGDRLALDVLGEVEGARLRVPVTSVAGRIASDATDDGVLWSSYSAYVTRLADGFERPLFSVVTLLRVVPDKRSQFRLIFAPLASIDDPALLEALEGRVKEAQTYLDQEPLKADDATEAPAAGGGRRPPTERAKVDKRRVARRRSSGAAPKAASAEDAPLSKPAKERGAKAQPRKF